jgi:hypothetical protein
VWLAVIGALAAIAVLPLTVGISEVDRSTTVRAYTFNVWFNMGIVIGAGAASLLALLVT